MTVQNSVAVRNARLDSDESAIGTAPIMTIRTGAQPADCAAANSGTVLATLTLPSDWMNAASGGTKTKLGTWQDASADNAGYARHYRIHESTATTCHEQGLVAENWAGSKAYGSTEIQVQNDTGKCYKCITAGTSAASGGPTGTGADITDGTVHWQYIGTADMIVDNVNYSAGQSFTVTGYTKTAGNA